MGRNVDSALQCKIKSAWIIESELQTLHSPHKSRTGSELNQTVSLLLWVPEQRVEQMSPTKIFQQVSKFHLKEMHLNKQVRLREYSQSDTGEVMQISFHGEMLQKVSPYRLSTVTPNYLSTLTHPDYINHYGDSFHVKEDYLWSFSKVFTLYTLTVFPAIIFHYAHEDTFHSSSTASEVCRIEHMSISSTHHPKTHHQKASRSTFSGMFSLAHASMQCGGTQKKKHSWRHRKCSSNTAHTFNIQCFSDRQLTCSAGCLLSDVIIKQCKCESSLISDKILIDFEPNEPNSLVHTRWVTTLLTYFPLQHWIWSMSVTGYWVKAWLLTSCSMTSFFSSTGIRLSIF